MNGQFRETLDKVIALEGGYKLHQNQGEDDITYAGIYRKAWPNWIGWQYLPNIPKHLINEFYFTNFWKPFDGIQDEIKDVLFDSAVNIGFRETVRLVQEMFGLKQDGILGPATREMLNHADSTIFKLRFTLARIKKYTQLASNKKYSIFYRGWISRALSWVEWNDHQGT